MNYPYDTNTRRQNIETKCPDDELFKEISLAYSSLNAPMYNSGQFLNGITNGAAWYTDNGGMQDWNYVRTYSDFEVTIELGTKWPPASVLTTYWNVSYFFS